MKQHPDLLIFSGSVEQSQPPIRDLDDDHVNGVILRLQFVFFIPHVIYEHGKSWWNDTNRGKLQIHPSELSGNPTSRVI
jgi:hypothetical protein